MEPITLFATPHQYPTCLNRENQKGEANPLSKDQSKEAIHQLFENNRLSLRTISIKQEAQYLLEQDADPRPVFLIQKGVPVKRRERDVTIGIADPDVLGCYKHNAHTCNLQTHKKTKQLTDLEIKLLPDLDSLREKLHEQAQQNREVYVRQFTSGHLQPDGSFTLPKPRANLEKELTIPHSELLMTGYSRQQIKFFCVGKEDIKKNLGLILNQKKELEQQLSIAPLPLVVYQDNGSIEIYSDDDIGCLDSLSHQEGLLDGFCLSCKIIPTTLRSLLNLLPLAVKAKAISGVPLKINPAFLQQKQELIGMLTAHKKYDHSRILKIIDSGFPINTLLLVGHRYETPLDLLIRTERYRYNGHPSPGHPVTETDPTFQDEAVKIFRTLVEAGVWLSDFRKDYALSGFRTPPVLFNLLKAMQLSSNNNCIYHLLPMDFQQCPGAIVEFDERCRRQSAAELQESLEHALTHQYHRWSDEHSCTAHDPFRLKLLVLFCYGAVVNEKVFGEFTDRINRYLPDNDSANSSYSQDRHHEWIWQLWHEWEQHQELPEWRIKVRQARQHLADLALTLQHKRITATCEPLNDLQFLTDAFSVPPSLPQAGDNDETILQVLQHYYRRPGPERVVQQLNKHTLAQIWKPTHSCSHVLRVRNNVLWYMELLESMQIEQFTEDEKTLLALAAIYHDSAAEDVPKDQEEVKSSGYFYRDLAGQYPAELLKDITLAMASKEDDIHGKVNPPKSLHRYMQVLRFADRLDILRSCAVDASFPALTKTRQKGFDPKRLNLPQHCAAGFSADSSTKSHFQRHLEAAMHGAVDLAQVTGGLYCDLREEPYARRYKLKPDDDDKLLASYFERAVQPLTALDEFIDDNVRRTIARLSGINTCSTPDHKRCRSDTRLGVTYGIHNSGYDLKQVRIPPGMTRLEKMQCEYDLTLLRPETLAGINREADRLRAEGLTMNPGTLTQETLSSPAARRVLRNRGITVITEQRRRGYDETGNPVYETVLVPKKSSSGLSPGTPIQGRL